MTPNDAPPKGSSEERRIRLCPVLATIRPTLESGKAYAYAILSDRAVTYPNGDSRIAYIGTGMGDNPVRAIDQMGRQFNRLRERWAPLPQRRGPSPPDPTGVVQGLETRGIGVISDPLHKP